MSRTIRDEFAAMMQAEGVRPLSREGRLSSRPTAPARPEPTPPRPSASRSPPDAGPAETRLVEAETRAARAEARQVEAEARAAQAEARQVEAETRAAQAEARLDELRAAAETLEARLRDTEARCAELDQERRLLQRRLDAARDPGPAKVAPPPAPTAGSLDPEPDETPSALRAAWAEFRAACARAGRARVLVVGGSPTYHNQLHELNAAGTPHLILVPGDRKRSRQQARRDEGRADLLILWGGTMLDHAVSGLYGQDRLAPLRIAHRGLAGMLRLAARELGRPTAGEQSSV